MLLISFYFIFLLSSYTLYAFHISQSQLRNAKIWKFSHQNQINQIDYHKPSIYALSTTPRSINQYDSNIVSSILKSTAFVASSLLLTTSELQIANAATEEDLSNIKCTILGAGGKTGKLIIERLSRLGATSVPVYREVPTSNPWRDFKNINEPLAADVTKIETLEFAIQGSSVVVFAVSASRKGGKADIVDYLGVENVAKECVRLKIPKLIVISSAAVTKPDSLGFKFTNIFGRIMEYKLKGELALQQIYKNADSSLSFIIVRPGGLLDGNSVGAGKIMINQGDTIVGEINRADVADCVASAAISKTIPNNVVFEVYESGKGGPLEDKFPNVSGYERDGKVLGPNYDILFSGLKTNINGL